jgi:hypothetical protein
MMEERKEWPPLIVAKHQSAWIRGRDVALTTVMWLLLAFMMKPQIEMLLASLIEHLGFGPLFERLGFEPLGMDANWREYFGQLSPYLAVAFVMVAFLIGFSFRTLMMRRRALRQSPPQPLILASEARHAGLGAMRGYSGSATDALHTNREDAAFIMQWRSACETWLQGATEIKPPSSMPVACRSLTFISMPTAGFMSRVRGSRRNGRRRGKSQEDKRRGLATLEVLSTP